MRGPGKSLHPLSCFALPGGFQQRGPCLQSVMMPAQTPRAKDISTFAGRKIRNGKTHRNQMWGKPRVVHVGETI